MSVSIERGYEFRVTPTGVELQAGGSTAAWTIPSLVAVLNDGSEHFLVADFSHEGGADWRLLTSLDGAPFVNRGTASGPSVLATDTAPSIALSAADEAAWVDEVAMWANHTEFTDEQLANLHALGDTHGRPMNEYGEQFPSRVSSASAQVDWVAPNRRTGATAAQVDWVAPNRRAGAVGVAVDFHSPPLSGANLLVNPGAEDGDTTGWASSQSEGGDGPFEVRSTDPDPYAGSFYFTAGATGGSDGTTKTLSQEVDLVLAGFSPATLDGSPLIGFGGWQASFGGADTGRIELEFLDGPGGAVIGSHSGGSLAPIGWTEQRHVVRVPTGTRAVRFGFTGTKEESGSNIDSYLDGAYVVLDAATTTAPPTTTTVPPTTTAAPTTTVPPTTTAGPVPHPADINADFVMPSSDVLPYANAYLTNDDSKFPGISPQNRTAYVLKAAWIFLNSATYEYEDVGTTAPVDSQQHPQRWQPI